MALKHLRGFVSFESHSNLEGLALQVMSISNLIAQEFDGKRDLSGIGGVETGKDAAEFLLLGANSVQVRPPCYD